MTNVAQPVRRSPPAARVVTILDFLAENPEERFGLSELARCVELSKPTTLGILTTLTSAGYVLRDEHTKTYRLGPALIALGSAAQRCLHVGPAARAELRRLSAAFDTTAALSAVVGDRITLIEVVAPAGAKGVVQPGESYPFAPPVGLMFVLWDDEALRAWLDRRPAFPLTSDNDRLDRVIAECRSAGYLVERLTPAGRRLYSLLAGLTTKLPDELQALLGELVSDIGERVYLAGEADEQPDERHDIQLIAAPVYDADRHQAMVMSLQVGRGLTTAEVDTWARELVAAADAVGAQFDRAHSRPGRR